MNECGASLPLKKEILIADFVQETSSRLSAALEQLFTCEKDGIKISPFIGTHHRTRNYETDFFAS